MESVDPAEELEHLFSYGTLQTEAVQLATFGRKLKGEPDTLPGYRETRIEIKDSGVTVTSGDKYYLNAQFTGRESDSVEGTRFQVTRNELEQSDVYEEAADYKRINVRLKSGTPSWAYISAAS
ncbi:MAG TPA: gamma-glutamylcyclotransferase family protein [Pyrinomonadaceae bacterium]|nr:gamma-glutamylcyclotransferase family protein [Pyrinomonadaceae bacterium]